MFRGLLSTWVSMRREEEGIGSASRAVNGRRVSIPSELGNFCGSIVGISESLIHFEVMCPWKAEIANF